MEEGDGLTDEKGELLPVLSTSAKKMDYDKLLKTPMPTFEGATPGSPFWTNIGYFCLYRTFNNIFRTFEVTGNESIPTDRGSLCAAWHTNGLLDPISIFLTHPKRFVMGGRHDLVTRPLLGFWTRKFAVQPVVRKAELLRGGCSEEDATYLNGRSLLKLATGISHGFGCALFPEGTSHSESHLIRLRTGPMRTVLAAAAHAKATGNKTPVILPIGLHFRVRHLYRTDAWVEFGEPIEVPSGDLPEELVTAVGNGDWSEPPADTVIKLRDLLEEKLNYLTPNKETFDDYRADQIVAHVKARKDGKRIPTWREEVLAAREVRDNPPSSEALVIAKKIGRTLYDSKLDGRAINSKADGLDFIREGDIKNPIISNIKLALFLLLLPVTIYSMSLQIILGRKLGDTTDEGLDARTSYQFLAGMFGSLIMWPIGATIFVIISIVYEPELESVIGIMWLDYLGTQLWQQMLTGILVWLSSIILFWISANTFSLGADAINDIKSFFNRRKLNSTISQDLLKLVKVLK